MILVLDASVAIKWFLHFREGEDHCRRVLDIKARDVGRITLLADFIP